MRIRSIKPEFWQSETMARTPYFARLMAIALLNYADDEGFFWASPQVIRGALFPFEEDSKNVLGSFQDLSFAGFLAFGSDEHGKRVGKVVNFLEHQRIDKPQPSKIAGLEIIWEEFQEDSKNVPGVLPVGMEWNGVGMEVEKEGSRITREVGKPRRTKFASPTLDEWQAYCAATWTDWHPSRTQESWEYYETEAKWTQGKQRKPVKDWKACASTAHRNAKEWGRLQQYMEPPTREEYFAFCAEMATRSIPFPEEPRFQWGEDRWRESFNTHDGRGWKGIQDWRAVLKADCQRWVSREIENRKRPAR
jgi:hypothetical protein